jgi:hypothetical protein
VKKKIITSVILALIALGCYLASRYMSVSAKNADKLSSLAAGMCTALFLVSLFSVYEHYKKDKDKTAV